MNQKSNFLIISDNDFLGRAVTQKSDKKALIKQTQHNKKQYANPSMMCPVRPYFFYSRKKPFDISVDHLKPGADQELTCIQEQNVKNITIQTGVTRAFYGWGVLKASAAKRMNRQVKASPIEGNPYHTSICIPKPSKNEDLKGYIMGHATDLAIECEWRPKCNAPTDTGQ